MASQLDPQPSLALIAEKGAVTPDWFRWFYEIYTLLVSSVQAIGNAINLVGQGASIGSTTIALPSLQNGLYQIVWYARVMVPDGVSSSLAVTIGFTDTAQPLSKTFSAMTGDTITTFDTQALPLVKIDQNTAITYSTTYASNTPGKMKYSLSIRVISA